MEEYAQIEFENIEENKEYIQLIYDVVNTCFEEEKLQKINMYLNIILTNSMNIRQANKTYRNIDKETDVLSFPMFEKQELEEIIEKSKTQTINVKDVLGDIIISIEKVKQQAIEFGHSTQRELAYMIVHGFYHIIGYDHIEEKDKQLMRKKEEIILNKLNIKRT